MSAYRVSTAATWLVWLAIVLASIGAAAGVFWQANMGEPFDFVTLHGETARMFGKGVYHNDTLFAGAAFRGTDMASLFLGMPAAIVAAILYRRGSLRGAVSLVAVLGYLLYQASSVALSVAYNPLHLLYIAAFSAAFFAFVATLLSFDADGLAARTSPRLPRRWINAYLLFAGAGTAAAWLSGAVPALLSGTPPEHLGPYTTMVTNVLDLGIIVPACFVTAWLLGRRNPLGVLTAAALLGMIVLLGPGITGQTVQQVQAGVEFTPGEMIGFVAGFLFLSLFGLVCLVALLRNLEGES